MIPQQIKAGSEHSPSGRTSATASFADARSAARRSSSRYVAAQCRSSAELGVPAEYGIVMLAAVGFAGLLVAILKSDEIRGMLVDMVKNALATGGSGLTFGLF